MHLKSRMCGFGDWQCGDRVGLDSRWQLEALEVENWEPDV